MFSQTPFTLDKVFRLLIDVVLVIVAFFLLRYLSDILLPFVISVALAWCINPLVHFLQHKLKIKSRIAAVIISLILVLTTIGAALWAIIPRLINDAVKIGQAIARFAANPALQQQTLEYLPKEWLEWITEYLNEANVSALFTADKIEDIAAILGQKILPGVNFIFSGSLNLLSIVVGSSIILIYLIFILLDYDTITEGWKSLVPAKYREQVYRFSDDVDTAMTKHFRAQAIIAVIVGVLTAIGFALIGLPLGIVLGLLIGLLSMVPYLQWLGLVPAAFFGLMHALETGQSFWVMMLLVLLIFLGIHLLQDFILYPKIMGDVTGLNSAIILLSISVWGKLLGMLGLIIALPATTLLLTYYQRFLQKLELQKHATLNKSEQPPSKHPDTVD